MPSTHAALIVDADPKGLKSLVYGFQGAEWRLTACPSPEMASLLVKASGAEIVVIASRADHDKVHSLVRQLRAKEAHRRLPILVLGPEELREPLKGSGEVDLLTLPAFVRDVLTASELLVAAGATVAQGPGEEPRFEAPVTNVLSLSLVRSMNGLSRSGHLRLERHGRTGEIFFHQGELTAAAVGQLQGMAAVQHLMVWNDGKLELRLRPVPRRGQMHQTAQEFLEELDRFQRDFAHAIKEIGPATTVYSANEDRLKQSTGAVPAEVSPVVRLCDGMHTLSDVIDESPFRVLDTVRILGRLAEIGILARADGKPVRSAALPAPRDEFLETARILGSDPAGPKAAPFGGILAPGPILRAPIPQAQLPKEQPKEEPTKVAGEQLKEPPKASAPGGEPAPSLAAVSRPRRQTLEIGIPAAAVTSAGQATAPAPAPVAKPAATVTTVPATHPPAARAPAARPAGPVAASRPAIAAPVAKPALAAAQGSTPVAPHSPFPLAAGEPSAALTRGRTPAAEASGSNTARLTSPATSPKVAAPAPARQTSGTITTKPASPTTAPKLATPTAATQTGATVAPQSPYPLATGSPAAAPSGVRTPTVQTSGTITARPASTTIVPRPATSAPPAAQTSGTMSLGSSFPPTAANPAGTATQAGGAFESRKSDRRTLQAMRAVVERPSVVIESIQAEDVETPVPSMPSASASASAPPARTVTPVQPAQAAAQAAPMVNVSPPVTGVLQATPSRRTAAQGIAPSRPSIQLDASLAAPPGTPAMQAPADNAHRPEPTGTRVTGEMHVASSGKTIHTMPKGTPEASSFQIDPSLSGTAPAAQPRRSDSRPVPLGRSDSRPIDGSKTRPSGNFSAVESDFFEREAELYKVDKEESFTDLDDKKAKAAAKAKPGGKSGAKPGRPYRR